jgi:predicted nucleic acid-binding protein
MIEPDKITAHICRDRNDLEIIGTAHACDAEVIITGDIDLLEIKKYKIGRASCRERV